MCRIRLMKSIIERAMREHGKKVIPLHPRKDKLHITKSERERTNRILAEMIARRVIGESMTFQHIVESEMSRLAGTPDIEVIREWATECAKVNQEKL